MVPGNFGDWQNPPPPQGFDEYSYYAPLQVDGEPFNPLTPTLVATPRSYLRNRQEFARIAGIETTEAVATFEDGARSLAGCPALGQGFDVRHERSTYAWPLSRRLWTLSDGASTATLKAWIGTDIAAVRDRFLHEGAATQGEVQFRLASGPGNPCVTREADGRIVEILWLSGTRVFRLWAAEGAPDLLALAQRIEAAPTSSAMPAFKSATLSRPQIAVGESVTLDLDLSGSFPVRLSGIGSFLRVAHGNGVQLSLVGERPGNVDFSVVAVEPQSLFSARRQLSIEIVGEG